MKFNKSCSLHKAKAYAFLLLKFRLRSEKELISRLEKKKFSAPTIRQTVSFLKEKGFIDDNVFARAWLESRIRKPLGLKRLSQELNLKGIDSGIIEREIKEIKENYSEPEAVFRLTKERFQKLKGIEPQKAKQRIYGYLLRRGFSPEAVIDALEQL